jgi:hypothetical protein
LTKNGLRSRQKCKCKRGYIGATCTYYSRAVLPDIPVFFASHSFSSNSESATILDDSSEDEFSGNYLPEWINFNSLEVPRIYFLMMDKSANSREEETGFASGSLTNLLRKPVSYQKDAVILEKSRFLSKKKRLLKYKNEDQFIAAGFGHG